jgi:hypothetical protein
METPRNTSDQVGAVPCGTEVGEPMDSQMVHEVAREGSPPGSKVLCIHQRLIDDVRTRSGRLTGKVRCLECGTVFDDPYKHTT